MLSLLITIVVMFAYLIFLSSYDHMNPSKRETIIRNILSCLIIVSFIIFVFPCFIPKLSPSKEDLKNEGLVRNECVVDVKSNIPIFPYYDNTAGDNVSHFNLNSDGTNYKVLIKTDNGYADVFIPVSCNIVFIADGVQPYYNIESVNITETFDKNLLTDYSFKSKISFYYAMGVTGIEGEYITPLVTTKDVYTIYVPEGSIYSNSSNILPY